MSLWLIFLLCHGRLHQLYIPTQYLHFNLMLTAFVLFQNFTNHIFGFQELFLILRGWKIVMVRFSFYILKILWLWIRVCFLFVYILLLPELFQFHSKKQYSVILVSFMIKFLLFSQPDHEYFNKGLGWLFYPVRIEFPRML